MNIKPEEAIWLAFKIGKSKEINYVGDSRDLMRAVHSRWDQIGISKEEWFIFEKAVLQDQHPYSIRVNELQHRMIKYLSGCDCPISEIIDGS